ncbi:MAG: DUF5667 domain-containing protein [Minisyncoccia bacterium]
MTKNLQELGKELKHADAWSLTVPEKAAMREKLVASMQTATPLQLLPSPYHFFLQRNALIAFVLVIALVGGSTTLAFAGSSLPGDTLYLVKTNLKEPTEQVFAFTDGAKVRVLIRHAEERLREIALLAADERPGLARAAEEAAERIEHARTRVSALQFDDALVQLSYALAAQADILEAQAEGEDEEDADSLASLALVAREGEGALAASAERAAKLLEKAREQLARDELQIDTKDALSNELERIEILFAGAIETSSVRGIVSAERGAYRVLALLDATERIRDTAKKNVLVRFHEHSDGRSKTSALMSDDADSFTATAASVRGGDGEHSLQKEEDESWKEEDHEYDEDEDTELEFRVLDLEDDSDENSNEDDDEDSSGQGSDDNDNDDEDDDDRSGSGSGEGGNSGNGGGD